MNSNHKLGKEAEKVAICHLKKNNFLVLDTNWRSGRYGEIDIVAIDNNKKELVFVEVKSRVTNINDAKELVTKVKQKQLNKLAKAYIYFKKRSEHACRFDVIAIKIDKIGIKLEHIKNAFYL